MKKETMFISLLNIFVLIILMMFNIQYINAYLFHLLFLLILLFFTTKKNTVGLIITLLFVINSFFLILHYKNDIIMILVYILFLIINMISSTKYVFGTKNNRMGIVFKTLKVPENDSFLIVKYINGIEKLSHANGIITKDNEKYIIDIEDKNGEVYKQNINFNDIENIEITEKPYYKSYEAINGYNANVAEFYFTGVPSGNFDTYKTSKVVKSYEIIIVTKKENITVLSFDFPYLFNK